MARLYIANCTRQTQVVCYRLDVDRDGQMKEAAARNFQPAKQQEIPPGRQVQIGSDFHPDQITDIVEQLERYGLIALKDVGRLGNKVYPYIWNLDAVPRKAMEHVRDHNAGIRVHEGRELRKKAAVAVNDIVNDTVMRQFNEQGINAQPNDETEVTFEQLEQSEAGESRIEEGMRVTPKAAPAKNASKKAQSRRASQRRDN